MSFPNQMAWFLILATLFSLSPSNLKARTSTSVSSPPFQTNLSLSEKWTKAFSLTQGQAVEISVGLPAPSQLPQNGRVAVSWDLDNLYQAAPGATPTQPIRGRQPDAFGIYTLPTANCRKVLHALD